MLLGREATLPTNAPIYVPTLLRQLCLPLHLPVEPTLFLLLPSRIMLMGGSTMLLWRKPRKLRMLSLVYFFINDTSIVLLFDSGALHSFIYAAYVEKHNLPLALLKCQTIVSSLGGDMPARQLCPKVNLKITGVDFVANLIVLESKGIDIILGMDWLSKHKVLIDSTKKSVKWTTPDGKELEFLVEPVETSKGAANHAKVNQMDAIQGSEVPVVNEFPDVFPEELLGMPSDRDIEFVIELKPSTAPIYKTPYRMATSELV
jgi:hypothetical protein